MLDVIVYFVFVVTIIVLRKSKLALQEDLMEELQQEMHRLRLQLHVEQNMKHETQDHINSLEMENKEKDELLTITKKKYDLEVAKLTEKTGELETKIQELEEIITNLKLQASMTKIEEKNTSINSDNSEELKKLEVEKHQIENAYSELQMMTEELRAQNYQLRNEKNELLIQVSEFQSKLSLKVEECCTSTEKSEALQEENALMKAELETLKQKSNSHSSKGNSLFAEVEDGRQQLKNELKKQKVQLMALQKSHSQTLSELRKLMKEKATICEELADAKVQGSSEDLQLQLSAYKERIKDLEAAQKSWEEEKATGPIVLGTNYESVKLFNHLAKEKREEIQKLRERYDDIMMRYIAATDEVVASKRETAVMERTKLRAEAEIVKLQLELQKREEGDHKKDILKLVVDRSPLKEIQNKKKCRFAPETVQPSSRKLVPMKETDKITYLSSS